MLKYSLVKIKCTEKFRNHVQYLLLSNTFNAAHSLHWGNYQQNNLKGASKMRSLHPSRSQRHWLECSHALACRLHRGISVVVCSENCEIRCLVLALTLVSLRQRILIVVHFRPAVLVWLPLGVYSVPSHIFGSCGVCNHTPTTLFQT